MLHVLGSQSPGLCREASRRRSIYLAVMVVVAMAEMSTASSVQPSFATPVIFSDPQHRQGLLIKGPLPVSRECDVIVSVAAAADRLGGGGGGIWGWGGHPSGWPQADTTLTDSGGVDRSPRGKVRKMLSCVGLFLYPWEPTLKRIKALYILFWIRLLKQLFCHTADWALDMYY